MGKLLVLLFMTFSPTLLIEQPGSVSLCWLILFLLDFSVHIFLASASVKKLPIRSQWVDADWILVEDGLRTYGRAVSCDDRC